MKTNKAHTFYSNFVIGALYGNSLSNMEVVSSGEPSRQGGYLKL